MNYSVKLMQCGINMPVRLYALKLVLPSALASVFVGLLVSSLFRDMLASFPLGIWIPYLLPVSVVSLVLVVPIYNAREKATRIEERIHLFITYLGSVSTATGKRDELMKRAMRKEEYGDVTKEIEKVTKIAEVWRQGYAKASRYVSKITPSRVLSEFLERLSFAFESGEDLSFFLAREQSIVMMQYEEKNKSSIRSLEEMKEILVSIMTSLAFVGVFLLILPMIAGIPGASLFFILIILFFVAEISMLVFVKSFMPRDRVMAKKVGTVKTLPKSRDDKLVMLSLIVASGLCITVSGLLFLSKLGDGIMIPVKLAICFTPLCIPGYFAGRVEGKARRRAVEFPALVRSIGSSMSTKGTNLVGAVYGIQHRDFGVLTDDVRTLYKRMKLVKDRDTPWKRFFAETRSWPITKFGTIFLEAVNMGGSPNDSAQIVSDNMLKVNTIMDRRKEAAAGLRSALYAISIGVIFALYAGIMITGVMSDISQGLSIGGMEGMESGVAEILPGMFQEVCPLNISLGLLTALILTHAAVGSVMIKIVDAGSYTSSLFNFVVLLWFSVAIIPVVDNVMGGIGTAPMENFVADAVDNVAMLTSYLFA